MALEILAKLVYSVPRIFWLILTAIAVAIIFVVFDIVLIRFRYFAHLMGIDTSSLDATAYWLGPIMVGMVFGGIIALIVLYLVTAVREKTE